MDVFKLKPGRGLYYPIDDESFSTLTGRKPPYRVERANGKESLYAVCPLCDNPIQIIGLYRNTPEAGRKPYGKHIRKSIPNLAVYNQSDYDTCPYANPSWSNAAVRQRSKDDPYTQKILAFLREYFDIMIKTISEDVDMRISASIAGNMLHSYIANEAWNYRTSRGEHNLPWVMAQSDGAHRLFGQFIREDSDLCRIIKELCPEVELVRKQEADRFVQVKSRGKFVNLYFHFMSHRFVASESEDHIDETICFRITRGDAPHLEEIFRKTIVVDSNRFIRHCISADEGCERRNERLLEIARNMIDRRQ